MNEAAVPNPALQRFSVLIGRWKTMGTHPEVPKTTFHGEATFEWMLGGAFLLMHTEIDEPEIPSGIAVFGSDDAGSQYFMLYFDERGVSRKYDVSMQDNLLTWWRETSSFSQRFAISILDSGRRMVGKGEMSKDGGAWGPDLQLTYTRHG
jgi:hypothetical protein